MRKTAANIFFMTLCLWGCGSLKKDAIITIDADSVINESYIGNGAQWDPYQLDYGDTVLSISKADWQKLYKRLDFMKPQLMRVMINTTSYISHGQLDTTHDFDQLEPILSYCQSRHVQVVFGDWGGGMVDAKNDSINRQHLTFASQYLNFLVNEKGYSCIGYYNMINEPNGFWSAADGNYGLWARAISFLHERMVGLGLNNKVVVVGPDAAIWSAEEAWWIDSCAMQLPDAIGLYDIHTYPSKITVNSGKYTDIIQAYQEKVPQGKKIIMGEIGFKYVEPEDSLLNVENKQRAKSKKYASTEDSQMFVYYYMYGIDMADALFQTVNAGYSGSIVWMLDDAMHSKGARNKLKVWGFWNILGDEYFGKEEENVRPWYYAWSLLTRYMPSGSRIFKVKISESARAIKAIALEKNGRFMLAVVNVSKEEKTVEMKSASLKPMLEARKFIYAKNVLKKSGDHGIVPNEEGLNIDLSKGLDVHMPGQSLIIYTTFND